MLLVLGAKTPSPLRPATNRNADGRKKHFGVDAPDIGLQMVLRDGMRFWTRRAPPLLYIKSMTKIMKSLTSRIFNGQIVRFIVRANGAEFATKDVCEILDLDHLKALERAPDWTKGLPLEGGPLSRGQKLTTLTEAGIYWLIMKSKKPDAEKFQRWVCEEVLPSIRRQGFYAANGIDPRLARVEQGRMLMEQARLMRREADIKAREAKALLLLEDAMSVRDFIKETPELADLNYLSILSKVFSYCRRNNIPVGRDADGRATVPVEALRAILDLNQAKLDFN